MPQTRFSAKTRWLGVALVLVVASSIISSWRSTAPASVTIRYGLTKPVPPIFKLVPSIFTVLSAVPTVVCDKQPLASETMTYKFDAAWGINVANDVVPYVFAGGTGSLNFAGLGGTSTPLLEGDIAPGEYKAIRVDMSADIAVNGVVTCDPDGAGPLPTRTYRTGGNSDKTVPDPFTAGDSVLTTITTDTDPAPQDFSVSFTVPGTVLLNATTTQGFRLWNISDISGTPDTFKIMPGDITLTGAQLGP